MVSMKAVILAGGFGTRMAEYTDTIPKPMVTIGGKPILLHIMDYYSKFGINDFVVAAGYKSEIIKKYFIELPLISSDFQINMASGVVETLGGRPKRNWNVTVIDTGLETMTGGRLLRLRHHLDQETFLLTYGDGLSNVDVSALVRQHIEQKNLVTVTSVRPVARFGELEVDANRVVAFKEKPQTQQGWINGGFFVMDPSFFEYISDDNTVLEKDPLEKLASDGLLGAYMHEGFWQCMDTKRDRDLLETLWSKEAAPWA
jgi:glucose-1-phosphate cytidylyltransferase